MSVTVQAVAWVVAAIVAVELAAHFRREALADWSAWSKVLDRTLSWLWVGNAVLFLATAYRSAL